MVNCASEPVNEIQKKALADRENILTSGAASPQGNAKRWPRVKG